jgi:ribose transport system substrate-binding protein
LRAIFAANDEMAIGALQALKELGITGIVLVGFGDNEEVRAAVKDGGIAGSVTEFPERAGAIAVDLLIRTLGGDQVPAVADVGFAVMTRETVDELAPAASPEPVSVVRVVPI